MSKFEQWYLPEFKAETGKWTIVVTSGGKVLNVYEYDTEEEALAEHKRMFIDSVMGENDD